MSRIFNLIGAVVGRLEVVERCGSNKQSQPLWRCKCECGAEVIIRSSSLITRKTKSCGCLRVESNKKRFTTHGATVGNSKTPEYETWASMHERCENPNYPGYKNYGGRGIQICARWHQFTVFLEDMGLRPNGTSIERLDNNGDYEPGNCAWKTRAEQSRNTRRTRMVTINGTTQCLKDWAVALGINVSTMRNRIRRGKSELEALECA